MTIQEAVALAKKVVAELFAEDNAMNIALEEVDRDDTADEWLITIGFSRPWNSEELLFPGLNPKRRREYKIVHIVGNEFKSIKNRELTAA